jgi:hypothetical protein
LQLARGDPPAPLGVDGQLKAGHDVLGYGYVNDQGAWCCMQH